MTAISLSPPLPHFTHSSPSSSAPLFFALSHHSSTLLSSAPILPPRRLPSSPLPSPSLSPHNLLAHPPLVVAPFPRSLSLSRTSSSSTSLSPCLQPFSSTAHLHSFAPALSLSFRPGPSFCNTHYCHQANRSPILYVYPYCANTHIITPSVQYGYPLYRHHYYIEICL